MKKTLYITFILMVSNFVPFNNIYAQSPGSYDWAKQGGAGGEDKAVVVKIDANKNSYVLCNSRFRFPYFDNFHPQNGAITEHVSYLVKYDSTGKVVWVEDNYGQFKGTIGNDITLDHSGNVFITGYYGLGDLYINGNIAIIDNSIEEDNFIAKIDTGGHLLWAKTFDGNFNDSGEKVAVDNSGNIILIVKFSGDSIIIGNTTYYLAWTGQDYKNVIVKLDSSGNVLWSKMIGSYDGDDITGLKIDHNNNIVISGIYGLGPMQLDNITLPLLNTSGASGFVAEYDSSGNVLWANGAWTTYNFQVLNTGMDVDDNGNVYICGYFDGDSAVFSNTTLYLSPGSLTQVLYVGKYDKFGNELWVKNCGYLGEPYEGQYLRIDKTGNPVIVGNFDKTTFTQGVHTVPNLSVGNFRTDVFISKMDSLSDFLSLERFGGNDIDLVADIDFDNDNKSILVGRFDSPTIQFGSTSLIDSSSNYDMFITSYNMPTADTNCLSHFYIYPDTVPHNWIAVNQATANYPAIYTWSWGDGTSSTGLTPTHIYNSPGYYNICLRIVDSTGCFSNYCDSSIYISKGASNASIINIKVITGSATAIDEHLTNDNPVNIYPNPSNGVVNITSNENVQEIEISNLLGQPIYKSNDNLKNITITLDNDGFYLLKAKMNNKLFVKKFLIQH